MEAEFFCLTRDVLRVKLLKKLISTHIDPSITLTIHNIEEGPIDERRKLGYRYEQLMQASIPPALGLSLSVTMLDWYKSRVYIELYWSILFEGYWSEREGTSEFFEGYQTIRWLRYSANGDGLQPFLPALAIRDHMVLVPSGQSEVLERVGSEKAVDVEYDVLGVDFSDDAALDQALSSVARGLMQEIGDETRAYSRFVQGVVDVEKTAADLRVPPSLLAKAFREEVDSASAIYRLLSCDLGQKTLIQGRWTKTTLAVRNGSDKELREAMVKISGPVELLPRNIKVDLPANSLVSIDVSIRPPDPGDFPLEIAFVLQEEEVLEKWLPVHHIWVQSMAP
jgi:hypothetical protein